MSSPRLEQFVTVVPLGESAELSTDLNEPTRQLPARIDLAPAATYRRIPPTHVNSDVLPLNYRRLFEAQWYAREQAVAPISGYRIRDALVDLDGIVIDSEDRLFQETIAECDISPRFHEHSATAKTLPLGDVRVWKEPAAAKLHIDGPVLLLKKAGYMNYGHWLIEMLPRVQFRRQLSPYRELPVLIHKHHGTMRDRVYESLEMAGIGPDSVLEFEPPVCVRDLYWVSPISRHNHIKSPLVISFLSSLADRVAPEQIERGNRLFLSRDRCALRRVTNEGELFEMAEAEGFRRVYVEDMSVTEQMRLFRSAEAVIGPLGAALTNIVFSPGETRVLILQPAKSLEFFFWDIACHRAQRFISIHGESVGETELEYYHGDYTVDAGDFRTGLEQLLA